MRTSGNTSDGCFINVNGARPVIKLTSSWSLACLISSGHCVISGNLAPLKHGVHGRARLLDGLFSREEPVRLREHGRCSGVPTRGARMTRGPSGVVAMALICAVVVN